MLAGDLLYFQDPDGGDSQELGGPTKSNINSRAGVTEDAVPFTCLYYGMDTACHSKTSPHAGLNRGMKPTC
jgi:hypothetical protein